MKPLFYFRATEFYPINILINDFKEEENILKFPLLIKNQNKINNIIFFIKKFHSSNGTLYLSIYLMDNFNIYIFIKILK